MAAAPKWNNGLVRSVVGELGTPPLGRRWLDALLIHALAIRVALHIPDSLEQLPALEVCRLHGRHNCLCRDWKRFIVT